MMKIIRKYYEWELNREQDKLDEEYEKYGLTENILEKQIALNARRNELDIPDKKYLNEEGFSQ